MVLYLVDKMYPDRHLEDLGAIRSTRDSLVSFKNEKQLGKQLRKALPIYDIIYIIACEPTRSL